MRLGQENLQENLLVVSWFRILKKNSVEISRHHIWIFGAPIDNDTGAHVATRHSPRDGARTNF
jgi:hypothetical protein